MKILTFISMFVLIMFHVNGRYVLDTYTIYHGGTIYTVDGNDWEQYPQQAMVVENRNGIIKYIGTNWNIPWELYETPGSTIYDLDGGVVFPGFHDVHMHPLEARFQADETCKVPSNTPPLDMLDTLMECSLLIDRGGWVFGHGHSIESILEHINAYRDLPSKCLKDIAWSNFNEPILQYFKNNNIQPRCILDAVFPDSPVVIMEETSHSVWVNSMALRKANIDRNTNITAGIIMKDDEGEPNGILFENAGNYIMDIAMMSFPDLDTLNYEALIAGLTELRKNGITSVCDARTYWKRNHQRAWERACNQGDLTVRAVLGLWAYPHENPDTQIAKLKQMYIDEYNQYKCSLRVNEIKVYSDGLLESTTAAMLKPYVKNLSLPGLSENKGMHYFNQKMLKRYIEELQSFDNIKGFDFHIHAIGDAGVEESLNAIEEAKEYGDHVRETRHRMTHLEIIKPSDITRFKELDVIADFQVSGEFVMPEQLYRIEKLVGRDRAKDFIPVFSVQDTDARVTLSSDWDVSTLNPFIGIQNAINRGDQAVTLKSAIEMRTKNAAYAMRQENKVGTLAVGKEADFIIIDRDPFLPDVSIKDTMVLATVLKGEIIFKENPYYPYSKKVYV